MRTHKAEGIVIKRRDSGETDKFITVFTREYGKLQLKAQGVRKIASKRSPHVELLNHISLSYYKGKGMPVLVEVNSHEIFSNIKEDLSSVGLAYHLCEVIDGLCPEEEVHPDIYTLLFETLSKLTEDNSALLVRNFEVALLTILGFWNSKQRDYAEKEVDTELYIESLLERRLKSRRIFAKV